MPRNRSSTARAAAPRRRAPAVLLAALAAAALGIAGCDRSGPAVTAAPDLPLGSGPLLDRTPEQFEADLVALRGQVVVVNFWASWCVPCRDELPLLQRTAEAYPRGRVAVVGVDTGDRRGDALAFLARNRVTFPTVFDVGGFRGGIASRWAVTGLPQTWFLGPDGSRSGRFAGAIGAGELRRRIDALLEDPARAGPARSYGGTRTGWGGPDFSHKIAYHDWAHEEV